MTYGGTGWEEALNMFPGDTDPYKSKMIEDFCLL